MLICQAPGCQELATAFTDDEKYGRVHVCHTHAEELAGTELEKCCEGDQ